jgi:hypothetical protein
MPVSTVSAQLNAIQMLGGNAALPSWREVGYAMKLLISRTFSGYDSTLQQREKSSE